MRRAEEGYPQIYWECHAYKPNMPDVDASSGPDMGSTLGALGAGDTANALQSQGPSNQGMGDVGMSFLGPIMSQMSGILGDSIREVVVIVRWGKGDDMQEMSVTKHIIDKTPVNQVAGMISAQAGALQSLTGGGQSGANGSSSTGSTPSSGSSTTTRPSPPGGTGLSGGKLR